MSHWFQLPRDPTTIYVIVSEWWCSLAPRSLWLRAASCLLGLYVVGTVLVGSLGLNPELLWRRIHRCFSPSSLSLKHVQDQITAEHIVHNLKSLHRVANRWKGFYHGGHVNSPTIGCFHTKSLYHGPNQRFMYLLHGMRLIQMVLLSQDLNMTPTTYLI